MEALNRAWVSRLGLEGAPYWWDLAKAELRLKRAGDDVVADLCLVGIASEVKGTLLCTRFRVCRR